MSVIAEPFWVQKRGCTPEEYEDAYSPPERRVFQEYPVRVAVADGATESIFARQWADKLVSAAGQGILSLECLSEGIARLRAEWRDWVAGKELSWFAQEKAFQGAFSSLLTLEILPSNSNLGEEGTWNSVAIGDSCLFHIRGEETLVQFPLQWAEEFSNRPFLLSSVGTSSDKVSDRRVCGTWRTGDIFLLMTDALACWYVKSVANSAHQPSLLTPDLLSDRDTFSKLIDSLRDSGEVKNDDSTLVRVQLC
jgi:hypothetical protein